MCELAETPFRKVLNMAFAWLVERTDSEAFKNKYGHIFGQDEVFAEDVLDRWDMDDSTPGSMSITRVEDSSSEAESLPFHIGLA